MIYSIEGSLISLTKNDGFCLAAIKCGMGVSFELKVSYNTAKVIENTDKVFLYTNLIFRETFLDFFGFSTRQERESFKMLNGVSGVGPSFALSILSILTPKELSCCIAMSDTEKLCRCRGVGQKTAKRIILELKDKMRLEFEKEDFIMGSNFVNENSNEKKYIYDEAIEALVTLGYNKKEASKAVYSQKEKDSVEKLIKDSLLFLSNK